jgi:hypothetical protein
MIETTILNSRKPGAPAFDNFVDKIPARNLSIVVQANDDRGCLRSFHAEASRLSMMRMAAILIRVSDVCTRYS